MKYIIINNPAAGKKSRGEFFLNVKEAFRAKGKDIIIKETTHQGHATEIAAEYANKFGKDCVIIACGGDGTVHEVANGVAHTDAAMMVLPFGTGNDFAKKIYGSKKVDAEQVVNDFGLLSGNVKYKVMPIDLIDYNGEKCINIMSFGLDTKVETIGHNLASKHKWLGGMAYNIGVVGAVCQSMRYKINCEISCIDKNGRKFKIERTPLDYTLLAICNASYYGGGFCPAKNAKLDDGLLDYALVEPVNIGQALKLIPKYSEGSNIDQCKEIQTGYMTEGRIWAVEGEYFLGECDGENFEYKDVYFKVDPKALNLCIIDK